MDIALFTLTSGLHNEVAADASRESFIMDIEDALGRKFVFRGDDPALFGTGDMDIIYVRTGGTEGLFLERFAEKLPEAGKVLLLTSGKSNSLAASMEIISWLGQQGRRGEILHGRASDIAGRILELEKGEAAESRRSSVETLPLPEIDLSGKRLGIIGRPSDWLISSDVDPMLAKERLGLELVDIPIEELIAGVHGHDCDLRSFAGSEAVYEALRAIVADHALDALTLRCFDLLDSIGNTGCLALARLNAEGIPSSCEGDVPALITMVMAKEMTGCAGFQCNLSRIEGNEFLFAHCTVPLDMVGSFRYMTHFESGIGTAIKGEIPEGPVKVMKVARELDRMVMIPGEIVRNQSEPGLCRTQVVVKLADAAEYFLSRPLGNHHVVVKMD